MLKNPRHSISKPNVVALEFLLDSSEFQNNDI